MLERKEIEKINDMHFNASVSYCGIDDTLNITSTYESFEIDNESIYSMEVKANSVVFEINYGIKIELALID